MQIAPHRKHYDSATKIIWLIFFTETKFFYCEGHAKNKNILCGQNGTSEL